MHSNKMRINSKKKRKKNSRVLKDFLCVLVRFHWQVGQFIYLFSCQRCATDRSIGPLAFKRQCHVLRIPIAHTLRVHGPDNAWALKRARATDLVQRTAVCDLDQWTKALYKQLPANRRSLTRNNRYRADATSEYFDYVNFVVGFFAF